MAYICPVSGTQRLVGHRVSHANNKTKRVFHVNRQTFSFKSSSLGRVIRLDLTRRGLRTIEKHGGFDCFIENLPKKISNAYLRSLHAECLAKKQKNVV